MRVAICRESYEWDIHTNTHAYASMDVYNLKLKKKNSVKILCHDVDMRGYLKMVKSRHYFEFCCKLTSLNLFLYNSSICKTAYLRAWLIILKMSCPEYWRTTQSSRYRHCVNFRIFFYLTAFLRKPSVFKDEGLDITAVAGHPWIKLFISNANILY